MFTKIADTELMTITSIDQTGNATKIRKCDKCGALVSADAEVCPSCHSPLKEQ